MEHFILVDDNGKAIELKGEIKIGRSKTNQVVLADPLASRHHATIYSEGDTLMIRDEQSVNGTIVNGGQIYEPTVIKDLDKIQFGDEMFTVRAPLSESRTIKAPKPGSTSDKPIKSGKETGTKKAGAARTASTPSKKKSNRTLWIVLGALVMLCVCCGATILIARQFGIPGLQNIIGFISPLIAG
jgi:pSer/pThr/pTyr-binding forkhead associated (FHA) protein